MKFDSEDWIIAIIALLVLVTGGATCSCRIRYEHRCRDHGGVIESRRCHEEQSCTTWSYGTNDAPMWVTSCSPDTVCDHVCVVDGQEVDP